MSLEQKDLELIERLIYKNADDIAVSIARLCERIEERVDAAESRLDNRLTAVEDKIEVSRQNLSDYIAEVRGDVRELLTGEL